MTKLMGKKVVIFIALLIFILSISAISYAKAIIPDGINWTYLSSCGYSFHMANSYSDHDEFYCAGSTVTVSNKNAYVQVVLQKLNNNGSWVPFATLSDEDYMGAAIDGTIAVDPGYTYRLKITHKAKTTSGTTVETYTQYSSTLSSAPRP